MLLKNNFFKKKKNKKKKIKKNKKKIISSNKFFIKNLNLIDYKNPNFLKKFINSKFNIISNNIIKINNKYIKRKLKFNIKYSKFLSLIPYNW